MVSTSSQWWSNTKTLGLNIYAFIDYAHEEEAMRAVGQEVCFAKYFRIC